MITEIVYIGRDNEISLILKARSPTSSDSTVQDITAVSRMQLFVGDLLIDSQVMPSVFDWTTNGVNGQLDISIGLVNGLKAGTFKAKLTVYDATHLNGRVWDHFMLTVKG